MTYSRTCALFAVLALSITPAQAAARDELKTALESYYAITKTGVDELRVVRPGTVLVIQAEGVTGNPSSEVTEMMTVVEDGTVRQPARFHGDHDGKAEHPLVQQGRACLRNAHLFG